MNSLLGVEMPKVSSYPALASFLSAKKIVTIIYNSSLFNIIIYVS